MKKTNYKLTIIFGVACMLFLAASIWYTITFNDSRLIAPTDFSTYVFQVQDLPMLVSVTLTCLYFIYLSILLVRAIIIRRDRKSVV